MNEWEWRALEDHPAVSSLPHSSGEDLRPGSRVRLRPRLRGSDAMDLMLAGKTAVIESIEQDYEGGIHLAVVLDDDPGRDLGLMRQPGHRFFYMADEVEPCADAALVPKKRPKNRPQARDEAPRSSLTAETSVLIAGIGNIFLGDDGFGVEVAQRLIRRHLPAGVRVVDYGIRSLDLAYALMEAQGATILIDACARGGAPGTLYVIEPDVEATDVNNASSVIDAHSMNPMVVIRMAKSLGGTPRRILLLGCEPETFGPDEGQLGLSDCVAAAVDVAVDCALALARDIHEGTWPGDRQRSA